MKKIKEIKLPDFSYLSKTIKDLFFPFEYVKIQTEKINKAFENIIKPLLEKYKNIDLSKLVKYGWFIEPDMPMGLVIELEKLSKEENTQQINNLLSEYYGKNIDKIFNKLYERYPKRKHIFEEIKFAYDNKKYFICIPSILTQIDGICLDEISEKMFINKRTGKNRKAKPKAIYFLKNEIESDFTRKLFIKPLLKGIPITEKEKFLQEEDKLINRHTILHGEKIDYGNKINTLKLISFLIYTSDLLEEYSKSLNTKPKPCQKKNN